MDGGKVSSSSPNVIVDIINARILTAIVTLGSNPSFSFKNGKKAPMGYWS
jgi:molybdopterin-binding protein